MTPLNIANLKYARDIITTDKKLDLRTNVYFVTGTK